MVLTEPDAVTQVSDIPGLSHSEALRLAESQMSALENELRRLDPDDWNAPTDCDRWSVHDIVAHIVGWAEVLTSPKAYMQQAKLTRTMKKELDAKLDAQNEAQVVARRNMSSQELIDALRAAAPKFLAFRRQLGRFGKPIPIYNGAVGLTTVRFLMAEIFTRVTSCIASTSRAPRIRR